ncbi:MAG TPA: LamG-like jellyroll fold domain-containing protein, partial [Chitinophagales bacterium]|nr:LamG-like jellyroll fold domain-containing protein [Chitinophagales bacterium]
MKKIIKSMAKYSLLLLTVLFTQLAFGQVEVTIDGTGGNDVIISVGSGTFFGTEGNITFQNGTAGIDNQGTVEVKGNWTQNAAGGGLVNGSAGTVILDGANQTVGGSIQTTFSNLTLGGTGIKTLGISATVTGTLSLVDREFATGTNLLTVTTTGNITRTSGFVSSLSGGYLVRNTNSTGTYFYPVGGPNGGIFRPMEIAPATSTSNSFRVRFVPNSPTSDGFTATTTDGTICNVNTSFYHQVVQTGADQAIMTMYFSSAIPENFLRMAHWQGGSPVWTNMNPVTSVTGYGLNGLRTSAAWSDFSSVAFGLASPLTPSAPVATAATNVNCNTFTANWNAATDAAGYYLDVASDAGFSTLIVNNVLVAGTTYNVTGLATSGNYYYRVRAYNGCGTSGNSNVIGPVTTFTATVAPTTLSAAPTQVCAGSSVTLTQTGGTLGTGATWEWHTNNSYTALVSTSTSANAQITVTPATGVTTYWLRAVNTLGYTCTPVTNGPAGGVAVTVTGIPAAPTSVTVSPTIICASATANLNATSAGNVIRWYTVASGGSPVGTSASGANFAVNPATTTTYYAEAYAGSLCPSPTRTAVTLTVHTIPVVTTATVTPTTICSGNTITLTATGLVPGGQGSNTSGVLSLNGASYVEVAANAAQQVAANTDFTYEMWVNPTSFAANNNTYFENGQWSGQTILFRQDNSTTINLYVNGVGLGGITYAPPLGTWTHLALVRSGGAAGTFTLYANGLSVGNFTAYASAIVPVNVMRIGSSVHATGQLFNGYIDEFRFWKGVALPVSTMNSWRSVELNNTHPNWASLSFEYKFNGTTNNSQGGSPAGTYVGTASYAAANYYTYAWTGANAPSASTNEVQTATPLTDGSYTVVASRTCLTSSPSSAATASITVNPTPAAPTSVTATPTTVCQGTSVNLNATSSGNTIRWWNAATAGTQVGSSASAVDFSTVPGTIPTTTYYAEAFTSLSCPSATRVPVAVTVNATSIGGTAAGNGTICSGAQPPANITLSGNTGNVIKWQRATDNTFTTNLADIAVTSTTLTPAQVGALTATTYFRAVVQNGICPAVNSTNFVTITVNALPAISSVTSSATLPLCAGSTTVLTANGVAGTGITVTWWTGPGGTGQNLGTGTTLTAGGGQTYYARVTGSCTPAVEASLNVTLEANAPTAVSAAAISMVNSPNNSCKGAGLFGAVSVTDDCNAQSSGTVNPLPSSGLVLWTKADAGVVVDGSGNVAEWRD